MKLKRSLYIPASFFVVMAMAFSYIRDNDSVLKLDGGPPYNTKAPGDKTCSGTEGTSPCHSGGIPDNAGPGTPMLTFSGGSVYVPGQTYTVTVTISHPTSVRFGFQIVSLKDSNNMFSGAINLLDTSRTRSQQPTWGSGQDRIYVMHRIMGTAPVSPNQGQWSYEWTAPPANEGNISFYACMVAANNNGLSDSGDEVYWAKITISPSAVGISDVPSKGLNISVYPNPATEQLHLQYTLEGSATVATDLVDMLGKTVQVLLAETQASLILSRQVRLDPTLSKGMYLVRSRINGKEYLKKLQIR